MMAFAGSYLTTSFKRELLEGVHDFRVTGGHTFKLALYTSAASLRESTRAYSSDNEVAPSGNYIAGGVTVTQLGPEEIGAIAALTFSTISFTSAAITARGGLIYNSTPARGSANPSVMVLDFGADRMSVAGTFTVRFPPLTSTQALIRIV